MTETTVFELEVGENCDVCASVFKFGVSQLVDVLQDATSIVKYYQSDILYDAVALGGIQGAIEQEPMAYADDCVKRVWALRPTGTDLVTLDSWDEYVGYKQRAKRAFIITICENGFNFKRIL